MKMLLLIVLSLSALTTFAEDIHYKGESKNGSCLLRIDNETQSAGLFGDDHGCHIRDSNGFNQKDHGFVARGSVEFFSCKIKVKLDENGKPTEASLSTLTMIKPIFTRVVKCKNFVRVN